MTIAAGSKCLDGVLLCADSQFTALDIAQRNKVFTDLLGTVALAFAIAGDEGYARTAVNDSFEAVSEIPIAERTILTAKKACARSGQETHR